MCAIFVFCAFHNFATYLNINSNVQPLKSSFATEDDMSMSKHVFKLKTVVSFLREEMTLNLFKLIMHSLSLTIKGKEIILILFFV